MTSPLFTHCSQVVISWSVDLSTSSQFSRILRYNHNWSSYRRVNLVWLHSFSSRTAYYTGRGWVTDWVLADCTSPKKTWTESQINIIIMHSYAQLPMLLSWVMHSCKALTSSSHCIVRTSSGSTWQSKQHQKCLAQEADRTACKLLAND